MSIKKFKVFFKILKMSNTLELIYVFLIFLILCAFLLMFTEPNMKNFGNCLWFCFASVTTIGYGDYQAVTIIGRIITVVLSLYGIIIMAMITGTIVNFVGEIQKMRAKESVTAFISNLEHLEDLSKEELAILSKKIRDRKFQM